MSAVLVHAYERRDADVIAVIDLPKPWHRRREPLEIAQGEAPDPERREIFGRQVKRLESYGEIDLLRGDHTRQFRTCARNRRRWTLLSRHVARKSEAVGKRL